MRILHVLDHSAPLHSGYAFRTLAILREQRARGWETIQLTSPKQGAVDGVEETAEGFVFHRTQAPTSAQSSGAPQLLRQMVATQARVAELVRTYRPDVITAHSPILVGLPALWAGRRARVPVVYEVRALWEDAAIDHGTTRENSARYRLSRGLETVAMRTADHVTTICEGLRGEIEARGVPPGRVTVVPNAVDIEQFRADATRDMALKERLGLSGRRVLGFAGSFYGYEGLDVLLEALARVAGAHPDVSLLLLGGGPQEAQLREQAASLGITDRVVFTGRIPHADVGRYYDLIDVFVYPRKSMRLTELVTPLKPLEAMARGRIVLASNVGGHRELIRDNDTGYLFAADSPQALSAAITSVLAAPGDWARVAGNGRRFVEAERTWAASVARYQGVYAGLTNPDRHSTSQRRKKA